SRGDGFQEGSASSPIVVEWHENLRQSCDLENEKPERYRGVSEPLSAGEPSLRREARSRRKRNGGRRRREEYVPPALHAAIGSVLHRRVRPVQDGADDHSARWAVDDLGSACRRRFDPVRTKALRGLEGVPQSLGIEVPLLELVEEPSRVEALDEIR